MFLHILSFSILLCCTQNKHLAVTDITNKEQIIGTVIQEYLAVAIRIAVIEKIFRSYRKVIRERYKPIFSNVANYIAIFWSVNNYTGIIRDIFR
jgi:hypothetical protein